MNNKKFRVWHKELQKYLPAEEWFLDFNGKLYFLETRDWDNTLVECGENLYIIEQFTGLLDKSGREIFENDIIYAESNKTNYIVKFGTYDMDIDYESSRQQGFYILRVGENKPKYGESLAGSEIYLKIIGNINQNKELLS